MCDSGASDASCYTLLQNKFGDLVDGKDAFVVVMDGISDDGVKYACSNKTCRKLVSTDCSPSSIHLTLSLPKKNDRSFVQKMALLVNVPSTCSPTPGTCSFELGDTVNGGLFLGIVSANAAWPMAIGPCAT